MNINVTGNPRLSNFLKTQIQTKQEHTNLSQNKKTIKEAINKVQNEIERKLGQKNLHKIIQLACNVYQSGYLTKEKFDLIEAAIEVKYPNDSKQSIISQMYSNYKNKQKISKQIDFVVDYMKQSLQNFDITYAIQNMHQYFTLQGSIPLKDFQQLQPLVYKTQWKSRKHEYNKRKNLIMDFYDQVVQKPEFLEGQILQGLKRILKNDLHYINQKKVLHVYTKKGYGVDKYKQYLQKRKLDTKQWQFYRKQLLLQKKYDKYLFRGIRETLNVIIQFIASTKKIHYKQALYHKPMSKQQYDAIALQFLKMREPIIKTLQMCARIVYDLNVQQKIRYEKVFELYQEVVEMRKYYKYQLKKMKTTISQHQTVQFFNSNQSQF